MSTIEAPAPTVTPAVTEADILTRTADLIEEFGHCKGAYAIPGKRSAGDPLDADVTAFCAGGAYIRARIEYGLMAKEDAEIRVTYGEAVGQLARILGVGDTSIGLTAWNDESSRTSQEVVQRLRQAAASLRE